MALQDQINSFQKLIFSHFRQSITNECKISALVPLVQESYGIYRFVTSMLRAMFQANGLVEVLEPLEKRYIAQFHRLANFYYECSNLKYLSRLIALPKLPERPVDLRKQQETVYLGLQPIEKVDEVSEREPNLSEFSNDNFRQEEDCERVEPFWENISLPQADAQGGTFDILPDMGFLTLEGPPPGPSAEASYQSNATFSTPVVSDHSSNVIQTYENRIGELENTLNQFQNSVAVTSSNVKASLDQAVLRAEMWAGKYENLAQLYTRLRKEHLTTIDKAKALDAKMKDYLLVAQRCKSLEKAIQEKSVLLLSVEREKNSAIAKLKEVEASTSLMGNATYHGIEDRLQGQLREKDEEIAIMKEAFDQSMIEIDSATKAHSKAEAELVALIESVLRSCVSYVKEAKSRLAESLGGIKLQSPELLFQIVEECGVLLLHLPEVLDGSGMQLLLENSLELAHGIGSIVMLSTAYAADLAAGEKLQLDDHLGDVAAIAERLFHDLSSSIGNYRLTHSATSNCVRLREKLTDLSLLLEGIEQVDLNKDSEDSNKSEVIRTALERTEKARLLVTSLKENLGSAHYSSFELALSSKIVQLAMDITNNVAKLLEKAAMTNDQVSGDKFAVATSARNYSLSRDWSNGFVSASKAIAGAISVLISVADGVLKAENDIEQLDVATQNVVSATTQLVVAARVKLTPNSSLRLDLENVAAAVISSCRLLHAQIRERLESAQSSNPELSMTSYELKVAEMDQQVRIVQLETALESARIKLGQLRKLSYAHSVATE
ncbi:hypothetical protein BJ508DRAFT_414495 [Ascobolus immersus RN42]|uniref:I/LWEQ domain-containing protein n=1 Tax=Ascobolus immersus RN42 TaxID=1160509 RepID=A0A3N4IC40_ASCIM|nr:hypothetical protein BJ508DRAFT_414495 [Ascobolus immersus RN42]